VTTFDNQNKNILIWSETGYRFIKRQSHSKFNVWVSLGSQQRVIVTLKRRSRRLFLGVYECHNVSKTTAELAKDDETVNRRIVNQTKTFLRIQTIVGERRAMISPLPWRLFVQAPSTASARHTRKIGLQELSRRLAASANVMDYRFNCSRGQANEKSLL